VKGADILPFSRGLALSTKSVEKSLKVEAVVEDERPHRCLDANA
jgi:hypothetical protein